MTESKVYKSPSEVMMHKIWELNDKIERYEDTLKAIRSSHEIASIHQRIDDLSKKDLRYERA